MLAGSLVNPASVPLASLPSCVKTSTLAGFTNEPANMNYYYEFYEGYKKDPGTEEEEEETTK